jgi:ribosomal protein S27AE
MVPSPTGFPEEPKEEIIEKSREKGLRTSCPMCGNTHFVLADGYFNHPIQTSLGGLVLGGPSVPTIAVFCSRCGFVSQHALGALGLLKGATEEHP